MKKKIIISGADKRVIPWAAFSLSLAVTGLGQVYRGKVSRGFAFVLLRVVAVISVPAYSMLNPGVNSIHEIAAAVMVFILITVLSPIEALAGSIISGRITKKRTGSGAFYAGFTLFSLGLTALSLMIFFSCFSLYRSSSAFYPLIDSGDIIIVNRIKREYKRGEAVIDSNFSPVRIIGLPGETMVYKNRILSVNGIELKRSIYTDAELNSLGLPDSRVISEYNGSCRYAVLPSEKKFTVTVKAGKDEYCAARDHRKVAGDFSAISTGSITASFEGVLLSPARNLLAVKPQISIR